MENKTKVLYFMDRMLRGGIQTFAIENIRHMDRTKVQIDFLLLDDGNHYEMEEDLKKLGCNIYILENMWIRKPTDYIKYNKMLNEFFKKHNDYKVIHLHASSKNFLVLKVAKKYGIPVRIAHSHNIDFQTKNPIKKLAGNFFKKPLRKYATHYFACSKIAGKWLFGKEIANSSNFKVIHNGVDLQKFKFNENVRNKIRKELNIQEETIVIGHVGRFTEQKNHDFLIDIFAEIHKKNENTLLLLVGTGPKEDEIKEKVKMLNLEDYVIFAGFINNVNEYLFAMDIFLFPSKYEGLPLSLIETQATGLPCYTSEKVVTKEAKITNLLTYISLDKSAKEWAEIILNFSFERRDEYENIKNNGYDILDTSKWLQNFYSGRGKKVSVIIPTYKRSEYITRAINSVLSQTYQDYELIVVDDNNPDTDERKELEKIMSIYKENQNVIYIQHEKNKNGAAARNTGIRIAKGEYITFLDDDDFYLKDRLQVMVNALNDNPEYGAAYTAGMVLNEKIFYAEKFGNLQKKILEQHSFFRTGSNLFFRAEVLKQLNGFDESFKRHQDLEIMVRFFEKFKILNINKILVVKDDSSRINMLDIKKTIRTKEQYIKTFEEYINKYEDKNDIIKTNYIDLLRIALKQKDKRYYYLLKRKVLKYGKFGIKLKAKEIIYFYFKPFVQIAKKIKKLIFKINFILLDDEIKKEVNRRNK